MGERPRTIGAVRSFSAAGRDITFDIQDGSAVRLSILAADLVRVRIAPDGVFAPNVSRAVVDTEGAPALFQVTEDARSVVITTSAMKLVAIKAPFVLECRDPAGRLVLTDDPTRRIQWDPDRTEVFKTTQPGEKYVGLGWRPVGLVRNGTTFLMRNKPTYDDPETFYSGVPLWYGLREGTVYGVFFDDMSWGRIDAGAASGRSMSFRNLGGTLDYYYFPGPTMAGILDRYTELTGRPYMPPRWSLGYHQCRWSYTPQSQMLEIAGELRARGIPCDVIYLDIDYMPGGHALTFDPAKFPDPAGMMDRLHEQGFHVVANVSPLLLRDDPKHAEARRRGYLLKTADGKVQRGRHFYWDEFGGGRTGDAGWIDFSKTAARRWWASQHGAFLNHGIDGLWNDLNEPDELGGDWPADLKYDFDGHPVDHCRTSPQYALLQASLSCDILTERCPERRPFVISRGGCAGIQRYAALWTGDNQGDWVCDFRRNIAMGLSMSISGNPHNGHDIGGFFGHPDHQNLPSGELYARWMQAGVFNPFCRQHHDGFGNHADPPRPMAEPWRFGRKVERICRDFLRLRYRLMPYLYTLFYNAHVTGEPVQRPTLFDFPGDPRTIEQENDFMFGPFLLVSPVTAPDAKEWDTYLPAGADWINWWDDSLQAGGQTARTSTPLERLPIFVRGGAILPTAPVSQYEGERPIDVLTIELYPVNQTSRFTLYEDDGISWDYRNGAFAKTGYTMSGIGDSFRFEIAAREGWYQPAPRCCLLKVHRWPGDAPAPTLNGESLPVRASRRGLNAARRGYFFHSEASVLYIRFADTGQAMIFSTT